MNICWWRQDMKTAISTRPDTHDYSIPTFLIMKLDPDEKIRTEVGFVGPVQYPHLHLSSCMDI